MTDSRLVVVWGKDQEAGITKRHKKTFGSDRYDLYLNCGDVFTGVYIWKNFKNCTVKYEQFIIYQICFNKAVKNKWTNFNRYSNQSEIILAINKEIQTVGIKII